MSDDRFDDLRPALDAFAPPRPARDLGHRVAARIGARGRRTIGLVAALAVAAAVLLVLAARARLRPVPPPSQGTHTIGERSEIALGDRATAIAEPGSVIDWRVDGDAIAVEHFAGRAEYDVQAGPAFRVGTPLARITVVGTRFSVAVLPAPALVVTVHEGAVEVGNDAGALTLAAGEIARVDDGAPTRVEAAAAARARDHTRELQRQIAAAERRIAAMTDELAQLRSEGETVEHLVERCKTGGRCEE